MDVIKVSSVTNVKLTTRKGSQFKRPSSTGSVHLTPHHLIFRPTTTNDGDDKQQQTETWLPLSLLYSVTRTPPTLDGSPTPLTLRTRDFCVYEFKFSSVQDVDNVWDSLKGLVQSIMSNGIESLYAFAAKQDTKKGKLRATNGWNIYEPEKEFKRMGVGNRTKAWRVSLINNDFEFCPSYPSDIVVPSRISDTTLSYAVKYRSKGRIPGLVYLHWANFGSITRSSQPMVGITQGARSIQDEKLVEAIFTSHPQHSSVSTYGLPSASSSTSSLTQQQQQYDKDGGQIVYGSTATNIIIDARPTKNAYANSVKGAGTENMSFYRNCRKEYLGIDNIHVMRNSLNGVYAVLKAADLSGVVDRNALRQTNWLTHLTNILDGTLTIVRTVHVYNSHVLVHCSDGWDRTSQLSSLPQLCLDPYYRTAEGFAVLIEKDWLSYGHKFTDRNGFLCRDRVQFVTDETPNSNEMNSHQQQQQQQRSAQSILASVTKSLQQVGGSGSSHAFKETCPVFQQFLDCVYQIMRQFPNRFEFNEQWLIELEKRTYDDRFGTFVFNSDKDRRILRAKEKTMSVWSDLFDEIESGDDVKSSIRLKQEYINTKYDRSSDDPMSKRHDADQGVLFVNPQDVKWWFSLFGRTDEDMNGQSRLLSSLDQATTGRTEKRVVESAQDDPVLNALAAHVDQINVSNSSQSSSPWQQQQQQSRTSTDETPGTQTQFNDAVTSVQKFGWSAWKAVQKYSQEAASRYNETRAGTHMSNGGGDSVDDDPSTMNAWQQQRSNVKPTEDANPWVASPDAIDVNRDSTPSYAVYQRTGARAAPIPTSRTVSNSVATNPWAVSSDVSDGTSAAATDSVVEPVTTSVDSKSTKQESLKAIDPLGVGLS
ncbi:phosphatidylinositol-3-phosphatase ymr1 [Microbotryomycetes sp. JL221]|nr:phosphatidylinositol-3-phosphatase ymr1 [Microbotryomycetes sp. JL221]